MPLLLTTSGIDGDDPFVTEPTSIAWLSLNTLLAVYAAIVATLNLFYRVAAKRASESRLRVHAELQFASDSVPPRPVLEIVIRNTGRATCLLEGIDLRDSSGKWRPADNLLLGKSIVGGGKLVCRLPKGALGDSMGTDFDVRDVRVRSQSGRVWKARSIRGSQHLERLLRQREIRRFKRKALSGARTFEVVLLRGRVSWFLHWKTAKVNNLGLWEAEAYSRRYWSQHSARMGYRRLLLASRAWLAGTEVDTTSMVRRSTGRS